MKRLIHVAAGSALLLLLLSVARADTAPSCLIKVEVDSKLDYVGIAPEVTRLLGKRGYLELHGAGAKAPFVLKLNVTRDHVEYTDPVGRGQTPQPFEATSTVTATLDYAIAGGAATLSSEEGKGSKFLYYQSLGVDAWRATYGESVRHALSGLKSCSDSLIELGLQPKKHWWSALEKAETISDASAPKALAAPDQGATDETAVSASSRRAS
jgi:hypothetical protein